MHITQSAHTTTFSLLIGQYANEADLTNNSSVNCEVIT